MKAMLAAVFTTAGLAATAAAQEDASAGNQFINADPNRYAQGVIVPDGSDVLYLGGQVGLDSEGEMPASFEAQARLAYENIALVLEEAGMTPDDLLYFTWYVVAGEDRMTQEYWGDLFTIRSNVLGEVEATGALVYTPALYRPDALIEISAIAARPAE